RLGCFPGIRRIGHTHGGHSAATHERVARCGSLRPYQHARIAKHRHSESVWLVRNHSAYWSRQTWAAGGLAADGASKHRRKAAGHGAGNRAVYWSRSRYLGARPRLGWMIAWFV